MRYGTHVTTWGRTQLHIYEQVWSLGPHTITKWSEIYAFRNTPGYTAGGNYVYHMTINMYYRKRNLVA